MPAQGRGRRDAEDEVDLVGATPVEDLRAAIVAVGTQQDLRLRPVGPDGPEHPAQESADFGALRALGGPQNGGGETAPALERLLLRGSPRCIRTARPPGVETDRP